MKQMTFTFTEAQAQVILNALAARPYAEVSGIIETFITQANQQAKAETKESI